VNKKVIFRQNYQTGTTIVRGKYSYPPPRGLELNLCSCFGKSFMAVKIMISSLHKLECVDNSLHFIILDGMIGTRRIERRHREQ